MSFCVPFYALKDTGIYFSKATDDWVSPVGEYELTYI